MKRPMLLRLTTREYFQTLISIGISFETGLHSTLDVSGLTLTFKLAKLLSSCTSLKAQIPQHPLWLSFLIPVGRLTYLSICFYIINYPCTKGNICFFFFLSLRWSQKMHLQPCRFKGGETSPLQAKKVQAYGRAFYMCNKLECRIRESFISNDGQPNINIKTTTATRTKSK